MSLRAYSEINLHIVWHAKHNGRMLRDIETEEEGKPAEAG